jgi:hypothetical protein
MKPVERAAWRAAAGAVVWWLAGGAQAAIYSCIDASGRRLTADRPIAACVDREQRLLNPDGSVRRVIPPTPTADERAEQEAHERRVIAERAALQDAIRRDRNLMARYPQEAAHHKARTKALDDIRSAVQASERRLEALSAERTPLMHETEFYVGKPLPHKLRQELDAIDAATEAQRVLIQNQQAELVRINALFDAELAHLRKLWAGAPAGSLGAPAADAGGSAPKKTASR